MKVQYTPQAIRDLNSLGEYFRTRNPAAGLRVRAAIAHTINSLQLFPEAGRSQTKPNVRKIVTTSYGYLIYYAIDHSADRIVILSIRHQSQKREYEDA